MKFYFLTSIVLTILLVSCNEKKIEQKPCLKPGKTEIKYFLFVGIVKDRPNLYRYNLDQKNYEVFWSNKNEKVVELSYSENMHNVFFITSNDFGKINAFTFIKKIKLYLVTTETGRVNFIEEFGNGIQVFSQWESNSSFRIIINSFDKSFANYVDHRKILYNNFGKKLEDITETYDITKQGYPLPPENKINYLSPDNKNSIEIKDSNEVYLKGEDEEKILLKGSLQIRHIEWRDDFLVLSAFNANAVTDSSYKEKTSDLLLYSLKKNKVIGLWEGKGEKNYFIGGSFLFFDDGLGSDSHINIFNLETGEIVSQIKIDGGCGLRNIPQDPAY